MNHDPYIGITDFMHPDEVTAMQHVFATHRAAGSHRILHVGVMMSHKTLNGIPTKWRTAFPPQETIVHIFHRNDVYNCLHFADYEHRTGIESDLRHAILSGGPNIHAIQLDMIWPDPDEITRAVFTTKRGTEVILQVGANAMQELGDDPNRVVRKLEQYIGCVDRVLLDKSMGRGLGMDAHTLLPFVRAIHEHLPDIKIGVAGGLGPDTMTLADPILAEFADISLDAQGQLRPSGNAIDPIDWDLASRYLITALEKTS